MTWFGKKMICDDILWQKACQISTSGQEGSHGIAFELKTIWLRISIQMVMDTSKTPGSVWIRSLRWNGGFLEIINGS